MSRSAPHPDLPTRRASPFTQPHRRPRHQEFLRFLKLIDATAPKDLELHLVLDNYATRKGPGDPPVATAGSPS